MNKDIVKIYTTHSFDYDEKGEAIAKSVKIVDAVFVYSDGTIERVPYNKEIHDNTISDFLHKKAEEGELTDSVTELVKKTSSVSKMGPVVEAVYNSGSRIIDTFDANTDELEQALMEDRAKLKPANVKVLKKEDSNIDDKLAPFRRLDSRLSGVVSQPEDTINKSIPGMTINTTNGVNRLAAAIKEDEDLIGLDEVPVEEDDYDLGGAESDEADKDKKGKRRGLWAGIAAAVLAVTGVAGVVSNFKGWRTGIANWWSKLLVIKINEKLVGPAYLTDYEKVSSDISSVMTEKQLIEKLRPGVQRDTVQAAYDFLEQTPNLVTKDGNFYLPIDGTNYLEFTPKELIDTIVVLRNYSPSEIQQVYNGFNFSSDSIREGFNAFYLKVMTYYMNATESLPLSPLYGENQTGYQMFKDIEVNMLALNQALKENPSEFPNDIKDRLFVQFLDLAMRQSEYKGQNLESSVIMAAALSDSYIVANRNIKEALTFSKDNIECGAKKGDSFYQVARIKCLDIIPRDATFATIDEVKEKSVLFHDLLQDVGYYNTFADKLGAKVREAETIEYAAVSTLKSALVSTGSTSMIELSRKLDPANINEEVLDVLRKDPRTAEIMNNYDLAMNADAESRRFARYDDVVEKMRSLLDIDAPDIIFDDNDITLDNIHELQNHRFRSYAKDLGGFGFYYGVDDRFKAPDTGKKDYLGTKVSKKTTKHTKTVDPSTLTDDQKRDLEKPVQEQIDRDNHEADLVDDLNQQEQDMFKDDPIYGVDAGYTGDAFDAAIHGADRDEWLANYLNSVGYNNMSDADKAETLERANHLYDLALAEADNLAEREEEVREEAQEEVDERNQERQEENEREDEEQAAVDKAAAELLAYQEAYLEWANNGGQGNPPRQEDFITENSNNNDGNTGNSGGNTENQTPNTPAPETTNPPVVQAPIVDQDGDVNTGEQTYEDAEPYVPEATTSAEVENLRTLREAAVSLSESADAAQPEAVAEEVDAPVLVK